MWEGGGDLVFQTKDQHQFCHVSEKVKRMMNDDARGAWKRGSIDILCGGQRNKDFFILD